MDAQLLDSIKEMTDKHKIASEQSIYYTLGYIESKILDVLSVLYKIKYEYVTDSFSYKHQYDLIDSIEKLGQITLVLINEQNKNKELTKKAMSNHDNSMYFDLHKIKRLNTSLIFNPDLKESIIDIIYKRKCDYIDSFGYFKSKEHADILIKKEFNDVSIYIDMIRKLGRLKYETIDNYDVLINLIQNLMYELSQLTIIFMEATESNIVAKINDRDFKCYFILMDFVDSCSFYPDKISELVDSIERLNCVIKEIKDMGLLCNLGTYKQDEVHGIFVGDIEKFKEIVAKSLGYDIKLAYGEINIAEDDCGLTNINETVYNLPFIFSGPATWEARKKYTDNPILIRHL